MVQISNAQSAQLRFAVFNITLQYITMRHSTHLLLVISGDGVVCFAKCHGDQVDHLSEERPLHIHLAQLTFHDAVALERQGRAE